jgi:hypothetical protein
LLAVPTQTRFFDDKEILAANKQCMAYGNKGEKGEHIIASVRTTGTSEEYGICVFAADAP